MGTNEFSGLLTQGLKSIAALEKVSLTDLQHNLGREIGVSVWTIYKWRKGTSIPQDDRTIAALAAACIHRGRMDRNWLVRFLQRARYEDKETLLNKLCPEISSNFTVTQNLPRRYHQRLVGRESELQDIKSFLSRQHRVGVVCISGGGGVGKTALALEAAHNWLEESATIPSDERFDAMVWVTAKNLELLPAGVVERQPTFSDLEGVYRAIAELLDVPAVIHAATQAERIIIITRLLTEKRTLLVLDNFEEIDDQELMVFLRDLPAPSKAIVTTRHRIDVAVPLHLHELETSKAQELLTLECNRHNLELTDYQATQLLRYTGGLPLAIIRTISRMVWRGSNIETEIQQLSNPQNKVYDFCFGKTIALIKSDDAYQLFMALALFANGASRDAIGFVAGFADDTLRRDEGLSDLEVLSLCVKNRDLFYLEPMTKVQALAELRGNTDFGAEARKRWLNWYLDFVERYGGVDWQEWHLHYDHLEADWNNILAVIEWCVNQGRYADIKHLWQHLRHYTHIYGYWNDRLNLLDWIIAEAESRGDWQTTILVMCDKAFTLTLTGPSTRLEDANNLLQRAWALRNQVDKIEQARIATLMSSLGIRRDNYDEAKEWLDISENLLKTADMDDKLLARKLASTNFDWGEYWLVKGDYENAKTAFTHMLEYAQISGTQRSAIFAQGHLAFIAIMQDDLPSAEQFLNMGWTIATRNKERRIIAFYKRSFAYYYDKLSNRPEAQKWASDALDSFQRLGMAPETREMQSLLKALKGN